MKHITPKYIKYKKHVKALLLKFSIPLRELRKNIAQNLLKDPFSTRLRFKM